MQRDGVRKKNTYKHDRSLSPGSGKPSCHGWTTAGIGKSEMPIVVMIGGKTEESGLDREVLARTDVKNTRQP